MGTSKQRKLDKLRAQHGEDYTLWCFEWRGGRGTIGTVPAPNVKIAVKRLLTDEQRLGHVWSHRTINRAIAKGLLSKLISVHKIPLSKPASWKPATPP